MKKKPTFNLGIAVYTKKDYEELLRISDDRESMNDTWLKTKREVEKNWLLKG